MLKKTSSISFKKSFASHPMSIHWSNKNQLLPKDVRKTSTKKYIFYCDICKHTFERRLIDVKENSFCFFCNGSYHLCDNISCDFCMKKSFIFHMMAMCWSEENKVSPRDIRSASQKKYIFNCDICKHTFDMSPAQITVNNQGCPFCGGVRLCNNIGCRFCFNNSFASHPIAMFWSEKNELSARDVFKSSHKKYKFNCDICKHIVEKGLHTIVRSNSFCCYCTGKRLCEKIDCKLCFDKSFASHQMSEFWSDENKISPRDILKSSNKKYKFVCDICKHEFEISLTNVVNRKQFCPYCGSHSLCKKNDCQFCFDKSFASHQMSKFWSNKNKISPRDVFKSSSLKYKFDCGVCKHTFEMRLVSVYKNFICPFCSGKKLCDNINCIVCFMKSFASYEKSMYWSDENKVSSRDVFKSSGHKYKFDCPDCHQIYKVALNTIIKGTWCPCTKRKTETKLFNFLMDNYNFYIKKQKSFYWCKNKHCLPFDFFIKNYNLIIELDGIQHFKQVSNWCPPEKTQKIDVYKMKLANQYGYSIIRIFQEDVWNDKNNWEEKLLNSIKKYNKPTNIFIGDIYQSYPIYYNPGQNKLSKFDILTYLLENLKKYIKNTNVSIYLKSIDIDINKLLNEFTYEYSLELKKLCKILNKNRHLKKFILLIKKIK